MKTLQKGELYQNLSGYLKTKGIELTQGSYAQTVQKGCSLLTEAINLGQQGLGRAKSELDKKLEQMRQAIHEKTAPKRGKAASKAALRSARTPSSPRKPSTAAPKTRARKSPKLGAN